MEKIINSSRSQKFFRSTSIMRIIGACLERQDDNLFSTTYIYSDSVAVIESLQVENKNG